jgi:hypothetical protein
MEVNGPTELSSRLPRPAVGPEQPWALGPPKGMKIADNWRLCPSPITAAEVSAPLPFVIPSELRISYTLHQPTTTYAAFLKESHTRFNDATEPDRKSGGSRGICSSADLSWKMFFDKAYPDLLLSGSHQRRDAQGIVDLIGCCRAAVTILRMDSVITSGWSMRTM